MSIRIYLVAFLALGQLLPTAWPATANAAEFIALGDIPYGQDQAQTLGYLGNNIRKGKFPFVVHYGDTKSGGESCNVALLIERRDIIYGLLPGRVFYTPGDNDWTDCDRPEAGGYNELERLDRLREIYFTDTKPPSDSAFEVTRQVPDYPENARWQSDAIQFVTLHIVGTNNGRTEILQSNPKTALKAVEARDAANLDWLNQAFTAGRSAPALVVFIQADPYEGTPKDKQDIPCSAEQPVACNAYLNFRERLTELAATFGKPVLLVHGSTNKFCLDTGFGGPRAPNLWRLNGPGDFVTVDAALVQVDAAARVPFDVHGLLSGDAVPPCQSN